MSIPDYQSLMLPVLVASSKGELRIGQVVDELADQLELSPEDRSDLLPSGKQTVFSNLVQSPRRKTPNVVSRAFGGCCVGRAAPSHYLLS
jgi:restriction endonuclease Mrr